MATKDKKLHNSKVVQAKHDAAVRASAALASALAKGEVVIRPGPPAISRSLRPLV